MNIDQTGLDLIKQFEGLRLNAYKDSAGIPTIGYGHTKGVEMGQTITQAQADQFLKEDCKDAEGAVNKLVEVPITQNMFDALVSFVFNLGAGALKGSTLLKLLNKHDYQGASEQFARWVYATNAKTGKKEVLNGLVKRREAERKLFLTIDEKPTKQNPLIRFIKWIISKFRG